MPETGEIVVQITNVTKNYRGLRPLRVQRLELRRGESVALLGFDQTTAEVLVDLITGATLPDSGEVIALGKSTASITDGRMWLETVDQFGLLSERAILVEGLTAEQNLAIPITFELDSMPDEVRDRVRRLAHDAGLQTAELSQPLSRLGAMARLRIRLARALALQPQVLLAEHPNASLSSNETPAFAAALSAIVTQKEMTALILTADPVFARAVAKRVLRLQPATGELKTSTGWRRWF
jgi:ABC-type lipoprotein export system ATPase subunit